MAWLSRSGRVAAAAIVAAAVVFLVGAQLAFNGGRIVAVVAPLAALLIAALGVAALAVARTVAAAEGRLEHSRDRGAGSVIGVTRRFTPRSVTLWASNLCLTFS